MLSGYKTYILVVVWIVSILMEGAGMIDIPGFDLSDGDMFNQLLMALGLGTLRNAIK